MPNIGKRKIRSFLILLVLSAILLTACSTSRESSAGILLENGFVTENPKGYFRVLIAGTDRSSGLSDVLMLASLNRDTGEAWVLQLPRDTYAAYTEQNYRKLNGAPNALGGMEETKDFLSVSLGLPIDRYMELSLDTFSQVVDALGGVEVELTESMDYEDPAQGLSIHLPAGRQTLDGKAAEQFVRYRSGYARGDLDRMDAQKVFLSALFRKICDTHSPVTLIKLATTFLGNMETDVTPADVMLLAPELLRLEPERVCFVTAPGMDAVATVSGASYYVLSAGGMRELLCRHFGAEENTFDREGVFLHATYGHFRAIYEGYTPYHAFSSSGIETNGLEK